MISRLKDDWQGDYDRWQRRDLSARHYVYVWADGVYRQARMEDAAACMLVIIGATPEGKKELVGFQMGVRESTQSWRELLVDLKARGLAIAPEVAVGDGAMGFWKALDEIFPGTKHQRCWVHKVTNVLNKVPKSVQPNMKADLREVRDAPDRASAEAAIAMFEESEAVNENSPVDCSPAEQRQISEGRPLPDERSRGAPRLLRLPGGTLGSFAHGQPDRERLRHCPAPNRANERRPVAQDRQAHGLQARHGGFEDLAKAERRKSLADGHRRRQIRRRCRDHSRCKSTRRLIGSITQFRP